MEKVCRKRKNFSAPLIDLSKAFVCLPYDLIIAKCNAYRFSLTVARLMQSYLCNRPQRTKVNTACSSWEKILFAVSQGSIIGPLLFNIFKYLYVIIQRML